MNISKILFITILFGAVALPYLLNNKLAAHKEHAARLHCKKCNTCHKCACMCKK